MVQLVEIANTGEASASAAENPVITDKEAAAMARAVISLFAKWRLTEAQACMLLGELPRRSYTRWKAGDLGRIGRDLKSRLSNLMGIHKALRIIFNDSDRVYSWVHQPNQAFHGKSALDVMLQGDLTDIVRVRRYLDAERGGW